MKLKELFEDNTLFKGTSIEKSFGKKQKATMPKDGSKKRVLDGTIEDEHHQNRPSQQGKPLKAVPYSHPSSAYNNAGAQAKNYHSHILK